MKLHARLVGTIPAPTRRWWQVVPPWCIPRPAPRRPWVSHAVPFLMGGAKDRAAFPPSRLRNDSTLVWSAGDWPRGVEVEEIHVEDDAGVLLFHVSLDVSRRDIAARDTVQVPPGGLTLELD